jgi:hypothetical protein
LNRLTNKLISLIALALLVVLAALIPTVTLAQTTEERLTQLEARVKALEDQAAKAQKAETALSSRTVEPSPVVKADVPLQLVDWSYSFEVGAYNMNHYRIIYTLKNTSQKGVKLNQSAIIFRDLLGEKVYAIKVSPDLKLPVRKNVVDEGAYPANEFIPEQMRLKGMDKENVRAELVVTKVVFDDGTVYEAPAK